MIAELFRRAFAARGAEFCEACAQVCTAVCRAEARRDRLRTELIRQFPFPR